MTNDQYNVKQLMVEIEEFVRKEVDQYRRPGTLRKPQSLCIKLNPDGTWEPIPCPIRA